MARARRHRPLLPRTSRVRWDPAMGWPFPGPCAMISVARGQYRRALRVVRDRKRKAAAGLPWVETSDSVPGAQKFQPATKRGAR